MSAHYSLREIVTRLGGELIGDGAVTISRIASLANAQPGQMSFITDAKYRDLLAATQASAIVISDKNRNLTDLPRIVTDNPYAYFARVSELLNPRVQCPAGIHPSAIIDVATRIPSSCSIAANCVIGMNVTLGEHVAIGPGCVIGDNVSIADHSYLQARVVVYQGCVIGKRCTLFSGSVIGADGFGYAEDDGRWVKIPQIGRVVIADDVDIGANTTIDRGALDDTVIEDGVKLDNLIQVGHNCYIGAHTVIAGCVGIAGSARIGKNCKIGGAAMILGHLEIADGVTISPGSMITRSISKADTYTALMPFQAHEDWLKTAANIRRMGGMADRLKQLEKEFSDIKAHMNRTNNNELLNKEKP
jgi:UDP-3-O-[3-hydroxymyristoyl] glucosamine N-acyltransferase